VRTACIGAIPPVSVDGNDQGRQTVFAEKKTPSFGMVKIAKNLYGSAIVVDPRMFEELRQLADRVRDVRSS
jgi:hypothetical protein